jgi:hypothetical protein
LTPQNLYGAAVDRVNDRRIDVSVTTGSRRSITILMEYPMRLVLVCSALILIAVPASAQDRPFLFLTTTAEKTKPAARFDYEVGVGGRAFQSDISNQPEQRFGVQATLGRLTFLGRFGILRHRQFVSKLAVGRGALLADRAGTPDRAGSRWRRAA